MQSRLAQYTQHILCWVLKNKQAPSDKTRVMLTTQMKQNYPSGLQKRKENRESKQQSGELVLLSPV